MRLTGSVPRGNQQFLVIAPETGPDAAKMLGERMRQRIFLEAIVLPDGRSINTTASFGVASLSLNNDRGDLLQRTDDALYAAKSNGRNQVYLA
ncbi:diguanylate cyclase domain-containing protein [Agrobacterium vitis]|uniref:diguanylate cyclase n=1 Tax=Agrobacterium vitis TaxID=373 RepID=A0AAE2R9Q3_AGRVI|nr:diguanylate cyclase [Agrobacterium vitis]MBF2714366.1 diguanylate cyclase [Agrobacterium vitis]MVA22026.1 diguanylate cyclase [Agrobacterium vitis]